MSFSYLICIWFGHNFIFKLFDKYLIWVKFHYFLFDPFLIWLNFHVLLFNWYLIYDKKVISVCYYCPQLIFSHYIDFKGDVTPIVGVNYLKIKMFVNPKSLRLYFVCNNWQMTLIFYLKTIWFYKVNEATLFDVHLLWVKNQIYLFDRYLIW